MFWVRFSVKFFIASLIGCRDTWCMVLLLSAVTILTNILFVLHTFSLILWVLWHQEQVVGPLPHTGWHFFVVSRSVYKRLHVNFSSSLVTSVWEVNENLVFRKHLCHQTFHSFFKLILFELQQACSKQPSCSVFNQKHEYGSAYFYKLVYCLEPHPRWEF